jgi:hypothetical protein
MRQSKRCLNLHLMPRFAVRRHPIDAFQSMLGIDAPTGQK